MDRTFYMPTESDLGVRAFRKWYRELGQGGPKWPVSPRKLLTPESAPVPDPNLTLLTVRRAGLI